MANPNIAGLGGSWVQSTIAGVEGASVGPVGGAATPIVPPAGDDFMLKVVGATQVISSGGTPIAVTDLTFAAGVLAVGRYKVDLFLHIIPQTNNLGSWFCAMASGSFAVADSHGVWRYANAQDLATFTEVNSDQMNTNLQFNPLPAVNLDAYLLMTGSMEITNLSNPQGPVTVSTTDDIQIQENSYMRFELENA